MKIRAMIAEDERLAREELAYLIQEREDFILCPSAENGRQLLELYHQYRPDVIFLDIEMPLMSGMEVARELVALANKTGERTPLFVFTTAYDEYAIEAFGVEAVDYLLKPYDIERLNMAITRVLKHFLLERDKLSNGPSAQMSFQPPRSSKLLIDDGEKVVVLTPDVIQYAMRTERFIEIYTPKEKIQTRMTLQELEEKVKGFPFFRPHRSYLVNLDYINEITPWFNGAYNIILKNKEKTKIPVSRTAAKTLFAILKQ
ncbi:LytR/AlgR family response regulator transcription factor [Effusibacillus consociatus]|uniref:LytR/AlgR family response regulator transcription factor n=1 Tax=Effusibacillus consociatus TaxID=1117041 RepID=A0ABV9Q7U7_9BACL